MRTPLAFGRLAQVVDQLHVIDVEEAILQAKVDVIGNRRANASKKLPGEAAVGIVDQAARAGVDARDAAAGAEEALQAVVGTEVNQAIEHEAQRADLARGVEAADFVDAGTTGAGFGFEAERAEIVTDDTAEVIADLGVDHGKVVDVGDIELDVFDRRGTAVEFDVPRIVTRQSGRGEGRGGQSHPNDQFPHFVFPL